MALSISQIKGRLDSSADGKSSLIYDGKWELGEKSVPGHVSFVKDGMIAFTDLEKRTLYKIDANNKLSKWISPKDLQNLSMEPLEDRIKT